MTYDGVTVYRRLLGYVWRYWPVFLLAIIGYGIFTLSRYGAVRSMEYLQEWLQSPLDLPEMIYYIPAGIIVLAVLQGVGTFMGGYPLSWISARLVTNLRTELMGSLLGQTPSYLERHKVGSFISRITYTTTMVTEAGTEALRVLVRDGMTVIVLLGYMFYLNWRLTLVLMLLTPPLLLIIWYVSRSFRRYSTNIQTSMGDLTQVIGEAANNFNLIKALQGENEERDKFSTSNLFTRKQTLKLELVRWLSAPMVQLLTGIGLGVQLSILAYQVLQMRLQPEEFMGYVTAAALLSSPLRQLTNVNSQIQKSIAAAQDIFRQLDEPPERDTGTHEVERVRGKVEFRNLSFAYRGSEVHSEPRQVIKSLNLIIEPGETVALVGRSGAGKTTISRFLLRFLTPDTGQVLIDDMPVEDYSIACLRAQVGLVSQQVYLFNDTVRNNLCYGMLKDKSDAELRTALRLSRSDEFVDNLAEGLETVIGEGGSKLSGGQRQRLALARGLLEDAPILLLDEATSSLDTQSERYIQEGLTQIVKGRTTLIIAHRLATIEQADRILVLDEGSIVESGTHQELLELDQFYADLYRHQFASPASSSDVTPADEPDAISPQTDSALSPSQTETPAIGNALEPKLQHLWQEKSFKSNLLSPLGWLTATMARRRHRAYTSGKNGTWRAGVPVIVVGNITVGGTGKTPVTGWLAQQLQAKGMRPGIVSRGYLGAGQKGAAYYPYRVELSSDPSVVGDEALMLLNQTSCPVSVGPDRSAAARLLLKDCDVLISDDGLQHYGLARDYEIAVLDGVRGFGNGRCLPAGPLREPITRLQSVDTILCNGNTALSGHEHELCFHLQPRDVLHPESKQTHQVDTLPFSGAVHCLAGLGNPSRFFDSVRSLGLDPIPHAYPDHYGYSGAELEFADGLPILTTEKDAIKLKGFANPRLWVLRVKPVGLEPLLERVLHALAEYQPNA